MRNVARAVRDGVARRGGAPGFAARLLLLIVVVVLFASPVGFAVYGAFRDGYPGLPSTASLEPLIAMYSDPNVLKALLNTAIFVVATVPVAVALALYCAWTVARTNTPLKWLISPAMGVMLALPPMFFALSWRLVGDEHSGLFHQITDALPFVPALSFDAESWTGIILVTAMKLAAFVYFVILGPVLAMDSAQEEASRLSDAGEFRTFFRITLPALSPAVLGALLLSVVICLESFDIPLLLGTAPRIRVISTEVYATVSSTIPPNFSGAYALSLVPIVAVCVLVAVRFKILGRRSFQTVTGKGYRPTLTDLGRARWVNTVLVVLFVLVLAVLPVVQLVIGSLQPIFGVAGGDYGLDAYRAVLADPGLTGALGNSLLLGMIGGAVAMAIATVLALIGARRDADAVDRAISFSSWLPWAAPGVVLSLGIYSVFLYTPGLRQFYGTNVILLTGLVISVIPATMRVAEGAVAQLSADLRDAARVGGAGPVRTFFSVVVRLLVPSLLSGWLISAIIVAGNLSVPILLGSPTSAGTVPVAAFRLMSVGSMSQAAALFILFVVTLGLAALVVGAALLLLRLGRRLAERGATDRHHRTVAGGPSGPTVPRSELPELVMEGKRS